MQELELRNRDELLLFTNQQQVYKLRLRELEDGKASLLGTYLPAQLDMAEGENIFAMVCPGDYTGQILLFFENGKCARLELSAYATKTNRRRLTGAYSDKSPLAAVVPLGEETELALTSTDGRALIFHTALLAPKASRTTQGVAVMSVKPRQRLQRVCPLSESPIRNLARYRVRSLPAAGALLREEDRGGKAAEHPGAGGLRECHPSK